jgi:hypothetical protein
MTKKETTTIVLGTHTKSNKYKNIMFIKALTSDGNISDAYNAPKAYSYIELICKDYSECGNGIDLMFAYDDADNRSSGVLYMGYWNEGTIR